MKKFFTIAAIAFAAIAMTSCNKEQGPNNGDENEAPKARKVLLATAQNNDLVLQNPAPAVFVAGHGDSAVTLKLRVWCNAGDYWTVNFDMYEDVKKAFDQFEIEIPFPQVTVHYANGTAEK